MTITPDIVDAASDDKVEQVSVDSTEDVPPASFGKESELIQDVLINEEAENQKANRALRSKYASKAHDLASGCIQFWAVLISANGIIYVLTGKQMVSDTAIIAVTTGVTINVLAAFLGVIRGLFPADLPKKQPARKDKKKQ